MLSGDRTTQHNLFNVHEYRDRMLPIWQEEIGKRKVTVEFEIAPEVPLFFTDKLYLQTAINHLMDEAIPRTRRGSIEIRFSLEQSLRGLMLDVSIEDTGTGMTDSEMESIAEFFEVDENGISITDMNQTLGFSVARNAIDAIGGRLKLASEEDAGTSATFSIPIKKAAANDIGSRKGKSLQA